LIPIPPLAAPAPKRTATTANRKTKPVQTPPPPAPLVDEQFRVFELAYGSGATMVLTAHTGGQGAQQKFVTLVAQPDLYGNVKVLLKNVTDAAHLDDTPWMQWPTTGASCSLNCAAPPSVSSRFTVCCAARQTSCLSAGPERLRPRSTNKLTAAVTSDSNRLDLQRWSGPANSD